MIIEILHQHALRVTEAGPEEMGDVAYHDSGVSIINWRRADPVEMGLSGAEFHELVVELKRKAVIFHPSRSPLPKSEPLKIGTVAAEAAR
jgi:hypothetical protein